MYGSTLTEQDYAEIVLRAEIIRALGTHRQRIAARRNAGLSLRDVSRMTGLAVDSIRLR